MSPSSRALEALNEHWAVSSIGIENLSRADTLVRQRLARQALGKQISFSFGENAKDESFLKRVALAFELAAIEGLDEFSRPAGGNRDLRDQAVAASFRAFDFRRLLSVPNEIPDRLFFVLQLSAIACCGDRWSGLRRWYRESEAALRIPSATDPEWDRRLLYRLFDCWVLLFRKQGREDLDRVREIIADLRIDQNVYEARSLHSGAAAVNRSIALRLAALYYWAKGTETLAEYMLQGSPGDPFGTLDKHFEAGIKASAASGDAQHEVMLRWLRATARIMATNSL